MKGLFLALATAVALPAAVAAQPAPAAGQRDWSRTVVQTAEGGFRMGNPDAPVKIVEYLSLTCPHCAAFAQEGSPRLIRSYVRTGRASLEYRNFVLNIADAAASMLARCGGSDFFFPIADRMLATQSQWTARIGALSSAQQAEINALEIGARLTRLAEAGGLDAIAAQNGVPAEQGRRCLSDAAALNRLAEMNRVAAAAGIVGTPTFLINGTPVQAHDWATLEPLIRRAGR